MISINQKWKENKTLNDTNSFVVFHDVSKHVSLYFKRLKCDSCLVLCKLRILKITFSGIFS